MTNLNISCFTEEGLTSIRDLVANQEQAEVKVGEGEKIVMLTEQEYRNMMETIYFVSKPELRNSILEGMATPLEECVTADKVEW